MNQAGAPALLDATMLQLYEGRLRDAGVPLDEWDRPGLPEDEIHEILAPLGLTLPVEARVWWGWHDGCPGEDTTKLVAPPGEKFLSLAEAVETYKEFRRIVEEGVEPDTPGLANPDDRWHPAWLPIRGTRFPVVIDCAVSEGEPTPVRFISLEDIEGSPRPRARSLGEMVSLWHHALDSGAWRWDKSSSEWVVNRDLLDDAYRTHPLV